MNEDLDQHLMEFVYGLLDEGEANALCERITSDPLVARAYAKVKLQSDLVARAARCDTPTVAWMRPEATSSDGVQQGSASWSASASRRLANWCIAVAAGGLICLMGSAFWMSRDSGRSESTPLASATATPVHVVLTGPSKLHAEASNPFTIQVEDQAGTPVSTTVNYWVYNTSGTVSLQESTSTDESGVARFDVEAEFAHDASRLEFTTADDFHTPMLRELEAAPERFVTYLRMDRPLYQPGETVMYRSVTLSRFGLRAEHKATTSFEIVDSNDEQLGGSSKTVPTEQGVGSGKFNLPSDLPDGTYTLIASSPDDLFREEWRDFHVRRFEAPQLLKKLELAKDSYTAGDQVDLDFRVKRVAGEPLAELPLQIQATLDGRPLFAPRAKTDAEGNSRFSLTLPESIERGEARVSVTVQEGDAPGETITKEIPINLGKVNVDFYPEGGDLAADLPNRVYFYARDPLGKPTHIEGQVVDANGDEITDVVTTHEGRGVFSFTPIVNEQYRLMIEKPSGVAKEIPLPATSPLCFTKIETGAGVFDAKAPIAFTLYQVYPLKPLIVAAYCRGAMVGQQTINHDRNSADNTSFTTFRGEIDLPEQAQGVIRLTVFDAANSPPIPIAERLVYRRIGQRLDVRLTPDSETFAPGQSVQLDVEVRDENDTSVRAVLGIAIVDDAVLNLADDKSTRMPTYFHLLTEIDSPQQLEDANFYLSDKPESVAALDSLLGTQGWRRFRGLAPTQLAQAGAGRFGGGGAGLSFANKNPSRRFRSLAWEEDTAIPLSTETAMVVRGISLGRSARGERTASSSRPSLAAPMIIASVVLLVLVGVASLRWAHCNRSLRVFAGIVAVASLLVGVGSLPMKPTRVGRATDVAAPAVGQVAVAMDKGETMIAEHDNVAMSEAIADQAGGLMPKDADTNVFSDSADAQSAAEPIESDLFRQLKEAPKEAARFTQPENMPLRGADAAATEKAAELTQKNEKKAAKPAADPRPMSEEATNPAKSQPAPAALSARPMIRDKQSRSLADDAESELPSREYAKWFYWAPANVPPAEESSTTIFWSEYHEAETGTASVYFNLPRRPSSYRAIVEAHGAGRLGAGELLINSR